LIVVTPPPFEAAGDPLLLPDLTRHIGDLARYAAGIRALAEKRGGDARCDLSAQPLPAIPGTPGRLTRDGWNRTLAGQARVAVFGIARQLGVSQATVRAALPGATDDRNGQPFEAIRQKVVAQKPPPVPGLAPDELGLPRRRPHRGSPSGHDHHRL
jgi:hypothetical protein